jgi:hypothetical protein
MNVWLARTALRIRGLSPSARVVLLAHVDACAASGRTCLQGLDELAQACELSPKHVMRLRAQLVEAGHLRKVAAAHPGQRPVYEVLPTVSIPLPTGPGRSATAPDRAASSGRTDAANGSHSCDPPYKPQGETPPTPPSTPSPDPAASDGGSGTGIPPQPGRSGWRSNSPGNPSPDAVALANAVIAALRPHQRTHIDELGLRRLERAAQPLVGGGWTPTDVATRVRGEQVDRAKNLAAVLAAILRRYALEPSPRELRAAERAAWQARAHQPPPAPCAHGDPHGCAACSFCRRGLADPDGERCERCAQPPALPAAAGL